MTDILPPQSPQNVTRLKFVPKTEIHIHTTLLRAFRMLFVSYDFYTLSVTIVDKTD